MKRLLIVIVIILMIDQVLTPFSYVFSNEDEIFDMQENVVIENEVETESSEDTQNSTSENQNEEENTEDITPDSTSSDNEIEENNQTEITDKETGEEENNLQTGDDNELNDGNTTGDETEENTTRDETEENNTSESSTIVILLAEKLGINREEDAKYYAELVGIDRGKYEGTKEQNEQIRLFLVEHEQEILNGEFEEIIEQKKAEDEETPDYSEYTKETRVAVLAEKLGINWEEDAKYYAELVGIERGEYEGTREQNEQIRLFFLDNLEEILNGEYEETITEMKTENQEGLTGDEAEFEIEVETGSTLTGEIFTGNISTGDVITGDIELVDTGCLENYHEENGLCEPNTKTVDCEQEGGVENSSYIVTGVTITWDTVGGIRNEIPTCEWKCLDNYHKIGGVCDPNTKIKDCTQTGGVENSIYVVTGVTITWDTVGGIRNEIPACEWKCLDNYHKIGGVCDPNTKIKDCTQTGGVENSIYIVTGVTITWNITGGVRNQTSACEWKCKPHYHQSENTCNIDTFMFTLVENPNVKISGSTQSGKKPYEAKIELGAYVDTGYRFMGWQILNLQASGSSMTTVDNQVVFNMPDRDVTATPLSEVIEYKIVYRNVDDAVMDNPDTYTIETPTFSLKEPTRTGYTFLGWTGSNGLNPEKEITLTKGNYGNKKYTAVWQPNSGIEYQVVHATEKVNSTSYEVRETEILTGTTDELTQAVAKSYIGFTAKEVTQKTIKGDGSTAVRVQYQRNIYTISFDSNGGSEINPITGKYGSDLIAPSNPTKSGYIFTGWKPKFPSKMPLSGAKLIAQWKQNLEVNDIEDELKIARETLNNKKIKGKETYNNITVNVEAPKHSFPEGTELRITPITGAEQKQTIKEELMKNTDVTEESELVSFDISFIYTLSGGNEVELQPYTGQTVKVSFNYKNNNKFNKSKKDKNKDLKVYHFEKVKNRKGKDTEKIEIKEVEINESESLDGELVIDAEKFSIYTIVDQIREETQDQLADFQYGVISISGSDSSKCISIMDRNLGATTNDYTSSTSYGYYYQHGNNYGFTLQTAQAHSNSTQISTQKQPSQYVSNGFITKEQWYTYNKNKDGNLWGGGSDYASNTTLNTTYSTNYQYRQGPCPDGRHVPAAQEWSELLKYYQIKNPNNLTSDNYGWAYYQTSSNGIGFQQWAKIPNAGMLEYNLSMSNVGSMGQLWSSSLYAAKNNQTAKNHPLRVGAQYVGIQRNQTTSPGNALPIRCFYNDTSCSNIPEPNLYCNLPWGGTVKKGTTVTGYSSNIVPFGTSCNTVAQQATCNSNGTWSVANFTENYQYSGCAAQTSSNCIFEGQTILNGSSLTVYSTSSSTCPTLCTAGTVTCNNGILGGNTGYINLSCNPISTTCDASFTLSSTGENGSYESCTPYTASSNTCNPLTTAYKLTNCDDEYHTEDNATCISNLKQVACIQAGGPSNSYYITGNVTITWNGTWNTGSWSTADNCDWTCDPHYHTGANNNSCEIDTFEITWLDGNGQLLKTDTVNYNETPVYAGVTPTKTATAQYSYTFNNTWSPALVPATADVIYTAQFNPTVNQYTATITATPSGYGSVSLGSVKKDYNSNIIVNGNKVTIGGTEVTATPTAATTQYTYTFSGWINTCGSNGSKLTGDCTITAQFKRTTNKYLITFKNWDGSIFQTGMVAYGDTPTYTGSTPTKEATPQFTYTFAGWSPTITGVTETATYTAIYDTKTNQYTATILVSPSGYGGVNSGSVKKNYGAPITINEDKITIGGTEVTATPTSDTSEWDYEFVNWTNNCNDTLTDNCTITANFTRTKKSYLITFKNRNGSILQTGMVEYGTTPEYNGATPTKAADAQYTYTFVGWSPEIYPVNETETYTAQFSDTINKYNVTFDSNGGTPTPSAQSIAYGSKATKPVDPIRTGYAFAGWRLNGSDFDFNTEITGTINLVAKWNLVGYTITYNLNGGTETVANPTSYTVESGAITLHQPTRVGYTFLGWTGSNGSAPQTGIIIPSGSTGDRIYNAVWQANTNTPYTVYHYVKKVGSGTYELSDTETKYGTTDETLTIGSLAKENVFTCAHYDRGSLTGTEFGPGEVVTQTTIRGDGTTKIYLFYVRDYYNVYLTGDEHVDILKINGVETEHAVLECGSEVPVGAVPKPGYHFVRRDKEERERRLEEEEDTSGE